MGSLRLRGRVWWVKYYRDGRPYEESTRSARQGAAKRLLRLRESQCDQGIPVTPAMNRLRFEQAATDLLTEYRVNGRRSYDSLARRIKHSLQPYFAGRRLAGITTADARAYIDSRQTAGAANATINRELSALKRMYTLALQAGRLVHRPHIPLLQEDNTRQGFFEAEQFASVRAHLPAPVAAIATFAYLSGWRTTSEVLPLQWHQVDRKAGTVRLEPGTTKNREARTIVYAKIPDLQTLIEDQWRAHQALTATGTICPFVFQRHGKAIKSFRRVWLTACKAAGCPGKIPHDFRRTAVRNLVRAGVPERVAMQMTGHKTRSVFERYNIVSEADLTEAAERFGAFMVTKQGQSAGSDVQTTAATSEPRSA
jgi:integrase